MGVAENDAVDAKHRLGGVLGKHVLDKGKAPRCPGHPVAREVDPENVAVPLGDRLDLWVEKGKNKKKTRQSQREKG